MAQWIEHEGMDYCSECGHFTEEVYDELIECDEELAKVINMPAGAKIIRTVKPYYCGYCGAKMREKEQ